MQDFSKLIQSYFGQLTPAEIEQLHGYFQPERLQKNEFFAVAEKRCDKLSFVQSGILRIFALHDGREITQWLSTENYLVTEIRGFFFNQPNRWSIQAFTDVELLTITKANYQKLCAEFPKWSEIEKQLLVKCFAQIEDRVFSHLSMTAEERYQVYFEQNRALFNQVPLQHIASVLGMRPETFSRIRNRQIGNS